MTEYYCLDGCALKFFRKKDDGTIHIFSPFKPLWKMLQFVGTYRYAPEPPVSLTLPSTSNSLLRGQRLLPETNFISFTNINGFNGPIITEGVRLHTFHSSLNYSIQWTVSGTDDDIVVNFYSASPPPTYNQDRMYLMIDENNNLTQYKKHSGSFVIADYNAFFVYITGTSDDITVELNVNVIVPAIRVEPLVPPKVVYLDVPNPCQCNNMTKVPVYKQKFIEPADVIKRPVRRLRRITELIYQTFELTSISLLLPIIPITAPDPITYNVRSYRGVGCNVLPVGNLWSDFTGFANATDDDYGVKLFPTMNSFPRITFTVMGKTCIEFPALCYCTEYVPRVYLNYRVGGIWYTHNNSSGEPATKVYNSVGQDQTFTITDSFMLQAGAVDVAVEFVNDRSGNTHSLPNDPDNMNSFESGFIEFDNIIIDYVSDM